MKDIKIIPGKRWLEILLLFLSDILGFGVAVGLVAVVRHFILNVPYDLVFDIQFDIQGLRTLLFLLLFSLVMLIARGLYPGWERSSVVELKQIVEAITLAYVLTSVIIFVQRAWLDFSRSVFILGWVFTIFMLPIGRYLVRMLVARTSWWGEPIAVIGLEKGVLEAMTQLAGCPRLGLRPAVGLAVDGVKVKSTGGFPILPWSQKLQDEVQKQGIRISALATSASDLRRNYPKAFRQIELSFSKTIFILEDDIYSFMMAQPLDIAGMPAILSTQSLFNPANLFVKRLIDIIFVFIFCVPVLLLGLLLALWIRLDSPGPILYTQDRIGRDGKIFRTFKFRTMVRNADEVLAQMLEDPKMRAEWNEFHKLTDDRRITRAGKWLRRLSLDELPQMINIFRGEMSLVGPRPYMATELDAMGDAARVILHVRPGMTGWWQVMGRNNRSFQERIHLELYYVFNWSLWLDLFIIIKTFWVVPFVRDGK